MRVYKTKSGYYYKQYKNGVKKRISKKEFSKKFKMYGGTINNEKEIQVGSKVDVMIPQSDITNYKQIVTRKIVDSDKWTPAVESEPLEVVRILSGNNDIKYEVKNITTGGIEIYPANYVKPYQKTIKESYANYILKKDPFTYKGRPVDTYLEYAHGMEPLTVADPESLSELEEKIELLEVGIINEFKMLFDEMLGKHIIYKQATDKEKILMTDILEKYIDYQSGQTEEFGLQDAFFAELNPKFGYDTKSTFEIEQKKSISVNNDYDYDDDDEDFSLGGNKMSNSQVGGMIFDCIPGFRKKCKKKVKQKVSVPVIPKQKTVTVKKNYLDYYKIEIVDDNFLSIRFWIDNVLSKMNMNFNQKVRDKVLNSAQSKQIKFDLQDRLNFGSYNIGEAIWNIFRDLKKLKKFLDNLSETIIYKKEQNGEFYNVDIFRKVIEILLSYDSIVSKSGKDNGIKYDDSDLSKNFYPMNKFHIEYKNKFKSNRSKEFTDWLISNYEPLYMNIHKLRGAHLPEIYLYPGQRIIMKCSAGCTLIGQPQKMVRLMAGKKTLKEMLTDADKKRFDADGNCVFENKAPNILVHFREEQGQYEKYVTGIWELPLRGENLLGEDNRKRPILNYKNVRSWNLFTGFSGNKNQKELSKTLENLRKVGKDKSLHTVTLSTAVDIIRTKNGETMPFTLYVWSCRTGFERRKTKGKEISYQQLNTEIRDKAIRYRKTKIQLNKTLSTAKAAKRFRNLVPKKEVVKQQKEKQILKVEPVVETVSKKPNKKKIQKKIQKKSKKTRKIKKRKEWSNRWND